VSSINVGRALRRPRSQRRQIRLGDVARLMPRAGLTSRSDGAPAKRGGRVVVITGASAGVGRAVAHAFAARGDRIALIARDAVALEEAAQEVVSRGGQALVLPLDVADADAVETAAARIEAELGPIDIWVNNAMVSVFSPVREMTAGEYRRVTEVTYLGYVHGTLSALRRMLRRDRGVIVQVGSALAYRAIPLQSAYCAAKHAINGFTESLRSELIHDGSHVRVTQVQLPAVNTPQFDWVRSRLAGRAQPVPPIYQPEVIAEGIVWAAEHDRRELVIGLSADMAILGDKVAPNLVDRYLARTGVGGQQADEPEDPDRPDNLFAPVSGLHGTRGRFDDQAKTSSRHLWWSTRVGPLGTAAAGAAVGLAALAVRRARS
jgi:NAD(P)-dependent dehydrogenase (short-subunit alcohol dehydrogenase family)